MSGDFSGGELSGISRVIDRLQGCFNAILTRLEQDRQYIAAAVSYYENMQRTLTALLLILKLPGPGSFTDADISKQPMGRAFLQMQNAFTRICEELTNSALINLREKQLLIQRKVTQFDVAQKFVIGDIRRAFQQYEAEDEQVLRAKRQLSSPRDFVDNMTDFGSRIHAICQQLFENLSATETTAFDELNKVKDFQKLLIRQEGGIVTNITELVVSGLPLPGPERAIPGRQLPPEESIWVIVGQAHPLFLELKSFVGGPKAFASELVPRIWQDEVAIKPFYARVWANTQGGDGELSVKKKELVQVLRAPTGLFWYVRRISGEKGSVPSAILEPLD
jgi:hypothetical protein